MVKTRKAKEAREDRRVGKDLKRLPQDINIYRWFSVYIKCIKELEGRTLTIRSKKYKVGFSSHKWWDIIDPKSIPITPRFIRESNTNLPRDIDRFFNVNFWHNNRDVFLDKTTIFPEADIIETPKDYNTFHFPKDYPIKKHIADLKQWYKSSELITKKVRGRSISGANTKHNAQIVLDNSSEEILKRLFHTLRIELTNEKLTNLDIYFQVQKAMYKKFQIPEITRKNAQTGIGGKTTRTSRADYEYEIRKTQRDRRFVKILLINLSNGAFPKLDRLI